LLLAHKRVRASCSSNVAIEIYPRGERGEGLVSKSEGHGGSACLHPCVPTLTSRLHHEESLRLEMASMGELIVPSTWLGVRGE